MSTVDYEAQSEMRRRTEPFLDAVCRERVRQDRKWGWPNAGLAGTDRYKKLGILMEEVGEVANALLEHDDTNLVVELEQVAAVCVAWLQAEAER